MRQEIYSVTRSGEPPTLYDALPEALAAAHKLQNADPDALILVADNETKELVLGWWLL